MKILIVEDNKTIAENEKKYLELENYEVKVANNGLYGFEMAKTNDFDCIVLDIMLPGMDWITFCQNIKNIKDIPIIMVTAKGEIDDKLEGFSTWADDYLVKPFDLDELVARIKAITARIPKNKIFVKGEIKIDIQAKKVIKKTNNDEEKEEEIKLTSKEFSLLELLIGNKWIALSRTEIIEELWGGDSLFEWDWKLDVYISTLRKKLGKEFISTVKGFWYKIEK